MTALVLLFCLAILCLTVMVLVLEFEVVALRQDVSRLGRRDDDV